jgi:tetratricopeptide (TPR) repeat protein
VLLKSFGYRLALILTVIGLAAAPAPVQGKIQSWSEAGLEELEKGLYDQAINSFTRALEINPANWQAYNNRGLVYGIKGELDLAIQDYGRAIEINPDFVDGYTNRGAAWFYKGNWAKALADCSKAMSLDSNAIWAQNQLAWILATCPKEDYRNGKKALELAKRAISAEDNLLFYDTLAAAYAELGDFRRAVASQEEAIKRLKLQDSVSQDTLNAYNDRLNRYRAGLPWRIGTIQKVEGPLQPVAVSMNTSRSPRVTSDRAVDPIQASPLPVPATNQAVPAPAQSETRPQQVAAKPQPQPARVKSAKKTPAASTAPRGYSIQAGAFLSFANAGKQEAFLKSKGYAARTHVINSASGRVWHLVLIGDYPTQTAAKSAAGDLTARENIATAIFPMDLK